MKILLFLLALVIQNCDLDSFLSKFHQHDYKIKDIILESVSYDENFVKVFKIIRFKYNRTTTSHNVTFAIKETMGSRVGFLVQGYKFLSNEYRRIQFRYQANLCEGYNSNVFGIKEAISVCGNVTECYFYKDRVYHICNFYIDESRFPPFIPTGQYKFLITGMHLNHEIVEANAYLEIYRPIYPKD